MCLLCFTSQLIFQVICEAVSRRQETDFCPHIIAICLNLFWLLINFMIFIFENILIANLKN